MIHSEFSKHLRIGEGAFFVKREAYDLNLSEVRDWQMAMVILQKEHRVGQKLMKRYGLI